MIERAVALVMFAASAIYLVHALRMPLGVAARPGPGFYPVAVGVFATVVALVLLTLAVRRGPRAVGAEDTASAPGDRRHVWLAVVTLGGFCFLMPWVGYPLAALLFVATMLRQLGAGWRSTLLTALLSAEGSYYLFAGLLGVTLPRGFWPH
jgi:putative tricarboxylic transport membrane protein